MTKVHRNDESAQNAKAAGLKQFMVSVTLVVWGEDAVSAERYMETTLLELIKPTPKILKHLTSVEEI